MLYETQSQATIIPHSWVQNMRDNIFWVCIIVQNEASFRNFKALEQGNFFCSSFRIKPKEWKI